MSLRPGVTGLCRYFFGGYKQVWLSYLMCAIVAMKIDPRGYLPSIVASFLLVLSIFALHATVFCLTFGVESGGRYILHGAYGFVFYFLAKSGPALLDKGIQWISARQK